MRRLLIIVVAVISLTCVTSPLWAAPTVNATSTTKESPAVAALNINTATAAEIEKLPGIGKKSAEAIVAYRTEKGNFKSTKELLKVKGVGDKTLAKVKDLIRFE